MSYTIKVTREGKLWLAEVAELPVAHSYAGNLMQLDRSIREAIALVEDLPEGAEEALQLEYDFSAVGDSAIAARQVAAERNQAAAASVAALAHTNAVAKELADANWSTRDIAGILEITPGRVSQILSRT